MALVVIVGCFLFLDVDEMLEAVRRMRAHEVALVLALLTCDRVLMALKWRLLLGVGGAHLPALSVIRIYYQGWLIGTSLPSHLGGDILRAHLVAHRTGVVHPVFASIVMEKVIGLVSAVNWAIAGAGVLACWLEPQLWPLWLGLGGLAALAFNGLFVASLHDVVHDFALGFLARRRQARLIGLLHTVYAAYADFSSHPKTLIANILLTVFEHGLQLLILFTIAISFGIQTEPVVFFAAAAIQTLIVRIPIAPSGWGTGELAAIAVFGLIGINPAAAFTISIAEHFLSMVAALPGFVSLALPRDLLRWTAERQWQTSARSPAAPKWRLPIYLAGCVCFSLGVKLFIDADLGVDPFHAMTLGLVGVVDTPYLQVGFMDGAVTVALLILWMAWNRRLPPLSTFITMVLVGGLVDLWSWLGIEAVTGSLGSRALPMLAGLVLNAYGSALIIMSGIGIRVVDLVALTLVQRLGWRFYRAKLALEAGFLALGFVLGGPMGIAAFAFVLVAGPFVEPLIWANQRFLKLPDYGLRPAMGRT
ncbi:MAG TPA: flippase-like domain-containing protein [Geminicoccaceae bacterium]|nr:flippase-like domain-containing protein [Geminicoccaceae bacterium]